MERNILMMKLLGLRFLHSGLLYWTVQWKTFHNIVCTQLGLQLDCKTHGKKHTLTLYLTSPGFLALEMMEIPMKRNLSFCIITVYKKPITNDHRFKEVKLIVDTLQYVKWYAQITRRHYFYSCERSFGTISVPA